MELIKNTRVTFHPVGHIYKLDGKKRLIGVTSLMKKFGLSVDYSDIPDDVLKRAADRGTAIHKTFEDYDNKKMVAQTPELKAYRKLGLNVLASEYLVSDNETVASSIDKVLYVDDATVDIADVKTTSKFYGDTVGIQLGIYAYLFERQNPGIKVRDCYGIHVDGKGSTVKVKLKPVERWPVEKAIELIGWERDGIDPSEVAPATEAPAPSLTSLLPAAAAEKVVEAERTIASLKESIKKFEESVAEYRDSIVRHMQGNGIKKMEFSGCSFTLKDEYTRESIDSAALRKKYPDIATECTKTTTVKASVIFKENNNQKTS
jgi:hypothetical protein